jgi:two-component system, chemotaxis family, chemotaxis protein CheY
MRILIADDEQDVAESVRDVLRAWRPDAQITVTANGEMALWSVENSLSTGRLFDLIISDWSMPKLTGLELLKRVRAHSLLVSAPFILLTGVGNKLQVAEAIEAGVTGYVMKPLRKEILLDKIASALVG